MTEVIQSQTVTLQTHGGPMQAQLRVPAGEAKRGAVIVVPEAFGVTPGIVRECDRLAAEGYLALGIEIFHRTAPAGWVSPAFDFPTVLPHFKALTNEGLAEDLAAARDFLAQHPRSNGKLAVVGFCVGGFAAYLAACRTHVKASVVYYGGGIVSARPQMSALTPLLGEKVTCPLLGLFGADDTSISESDRQAIEAALARQSVEHRILTYPGAGHAFRNDERPNYSPAAAQASWAEVLPFLAKHIG